jgi:hypothetical protein
MKALEYDSLRIHLKPQESSLVQWLTKKAGS